MRLRRRTTGRTDEAENTAQHHLRPDECGQFGEQIGAQLFRALEALDDPRCRRMKQDPVSRVRRANVRIGDRRNLEDVLVQNVVENELEGLLFVRARWATQPPLPIDRTKRLHHERALYSRPHALFQRRKLGCRRLSASTVHKSNKLIRGAEPHIATASVMNDVGGVKLHNQIIGVGIPATLAAELDRLRIERAAAGNRIVSRATLVREACSMLIEQAQTKREDDHVENSTTHRGRR